jgi:3-methyl-2-oxobutanoate hydroxymethyltransferase
MSRTHPTVADLRALKGTRQMTMLYVDKVDEAAAAAAAGIDMLSIITPVWTPQMREAAGQCFVQVGLEYGVLATTDDYLRSAMSGYSLGADCFYCAASLQTVSRLASEGLPVVGHVGLVPSQRTWTGGWRAVGKTAESALDVFRKVKALESAGAFAAEIEVVPDRVAAEISKRTSLLLLSMGAGTGCDAQYLFAEDVLGYNAGHVPRHARRYRDFAVEYERLQRERVGAFSEFKADVDSGRYPEDQHLVPIEEPEFEAFLAGLDQTPT